MVVGLGLAGNALVLTLAVTGYGPVRLAPWLPHLPLEFAALGIAAATYLHARRHLIAYRELRGIAALVGVLLGLASLLETYATPHV